MTAPVAAIDAGASHTRALLVGPDGRILARALGGPATARLSAHALQANLQALLGELLAPVGSPPAALSLVAGAAGAGREQGRRRLEAALRSALEASGCRVDRIQVWSDADIALAAAAPQPGAPAAVLLAGTGSMALAQGADGRQARAGGWGPDLGDEGGGAWFGRRALQLVVQAEDGRVPGATGLAAAILARLGLADVDGLVLRAAELTRSAADLALLAPLVFAQARAGSGAAKALVADGGAALAAVLLAARRKAGVDDSVPTALVGGLWRDPAALLRQALATALPTALAQGLGPLAVPPVVGAACLALAPEAATRLRAECGPDDSGEATVRGDRPGAADARSPC